MRRTATPRGSKSSAPTRIPRFERGASIVRGRTRRSAGSHRTRTRTRTPCAARRRAARGATRGGVAGVVAMRSPPSWPARPARASECICRREGIVTKTIALGRGARHNDVGGDGGGERVLAGGPSAAAAGLRVAVRAREERRMPAAVLGADGGPRRRAPASEPLAERRRLRRGVPRVHARPGDAVAGRESGEAPARDRAERVRRRGAVAPRERVGVRRRRRVPGRRRRVESIPRRRRRTTRGRLCSPRSSWARTQTSWSTARASSRARRARRGWTSTAAAPRTSSRARARGARCFATRTTCTRASQVRSIQKFFTHRIARFQHLIASPFN